MQYRCSILHWEICTLKPPLSLTTASNERILQDKMYARCAEALSLQVCEVKVLEVEVEDE